MKKAFPEPEIWKIELNLRENIATSTQVSMGYYFNVSLFSCTIQTTNKFVGQVTEQEAAVCLVSMNARAMGTIIPREEVLPHFRY